MDPAQIDRVEKLEKVYEAVCKFLKWRSGWRLGAQLAIDEGKGFGWDDNVDEIYALCDKVQEIMGVEIK